MEVGVGGAGDGALGRFAVTASTPLRAAALAACSLALAGCSALGGFAGAIAALGTSAATANPIVGISVGIGVKAAADAGLKYVSRRNQHGIQNAVAAAAADVAPGQGARYEHAHAIGSGVDRGEVRVVRLIDTPLAACKEILFSVEHGGETPRVEWFSTSACRNGDAWQWAGVEPAVERWGNLQ
jgi:hypothetical protein